MGKGKKVLAIAAILIFAIIAWTALDDITTGNEPSYLGEYVTLAASIPIIVFLALKLLRKKVKE